MAYRFNRLAKTHQKFALVVFQRVSTSLSNHSFQGIAINSPIGQPFGYQDSELWRGVFKQGVNHQPVCFGQGPGF